MRKTKYEKQKQNTKKFITNARKTKAIKKSVAFFSLSLSQSI